MRDKKINNALYLDFLKVQNQLEKQDGNKIVYFNL